MHAAKLATSDRLKRTLKFLSDLRPHTTREISQGANICAVSAAVSELRAAGKVIHCHRKDRRWYYRLVRS